MNSEKPKLSRAQLSELYPKAKTYDERARDTEYRQAAFATRRPKHPQIVTALSTTALFVTIILLIENIGALWSSNPFAGTSFTFIAGIVMVFALRATYRYTANSYYSYVRPLALFGVLYFGLIVVVLVGYVVLKGIAPALTDAWLVLVSFVHFVGTWVAGKISFLTKTT